jgi:hypothetical protein
MSDVFSLRTEFAIPGVVYQVWGFIVAHHRLFFRVHGVTPDLFSLSFNAFDSPNYFTNCSWLQRAQAKEKTARNGDVGLGLSLSTKNRMQCG